jgi:capsid protein
MLDFFNKNKVKELSGLIEKQSNQIANLSNLFFGQQYDLFDGEKSEGELGKARIIYPDYNTARERAWELQLTNDIAKLIINKWVTWTLGVGLRFNATPSKQVKGLIRDKFISDVEYRFRNYLSSTYCDYAGMDNFHAKMSQALYNCKVAGDILVVLRIENGVVTVQLIDGANVQTPFKYAGENYILDGVEYDNRGRHVAYWVYSENLEYTRIPAIHEPTGLKLAFLVYGSKFRLNEVRGLPILIEDFEKIKNIERYIDATVKNAEVSSELILINEHDNSSTGENVFKTAALKGLASNVSSQNDLPNASVFKNSLTKLTKGVVLNNTIGANIKMLKPTAELTMPDFLASNLKLIFASAEIPFEVAMSVYNSNYSASRAAIKDWEQNLKVATNYFANQTYKRVYELWLYNEVLLGNIDCFQLIDAYRKKDYITITAINKATFTGVSVPSIDPVKEVNAVRMAMGDNTTPLMTGELAAEIVSQQDFSEVQEQVKAERKMSVKPEIQSNEKI